METMNVAPDPNAPVVALLPQRMSGRDYEVAVARIRGAYQNVLIASSDDVDVVTFYYHGMLESAVPPSSSGGKSSVDPYRVVTWLLNIASFLLSVLALAVSLSLLGCAPSETPTPIASDEIEKPEAQTASIDTMGLDPMATAPLPYETQSVQPNVRPLTQEDFEALHEHDFGLGPQNAPSPMAGSVPARQRAHVRTVSFASPAVPLQVFRVDDHGPMTVDRFTYRRPRYAFVAIDIADTLRAENGCILAVWQRELATGSCYWPATFGRGKWMVIPIDTSPVVEFRRLSGPSILPTIRIADLKPISAGELK